MWFHRDGRINTWREEKAGPHLPTWLGSCPCRSAAKGSVRGGGGGGEGGGKERRRVSWADRQQTWQQHFLRWAILYSLLTEGTPLSSISKFLTKLLFMSLIFVHCWDVGEGRWDKEMSSQRCAQIHIYGLQSVEVSELCFDDRIWILFSFRPNPNTNIIRFPKNDEDEY